MGAIKNYTKHHLKFRRNQADNLVAVLTGLYAISAQIFSFIFLVFSIKQAQFKKMNCALGC